jgi:NAD(P)-dependent dehydrogenase (short-subunit alcohol dehydrogenase family)
MADFSERVAIVTGASSGIGLATVELLASQGARVAAFARHATPRDGVLTVTGDVAIEADVDRLFDEVESKLGDCDILVNCAGMIDAKPLIDTTVDDWDRMFAVNVRGVYLASRRALRTMIAKRAGAIVNVSSISGVIGPEKFPGWVSYCASKGAVISLTEALAVEVKEYGIRVNSVSPGSVDTKMWAEASGGAPANMTAAEVAEVIAFLASERSRPINGQDLHVYSS